MARWRARVHEIDGTLLEGLWSQGSAAEVPRDALLLEVQAGEDAEPRFPALPDLDAGRGFYCLRHAFETIGGESADQKSKKGSVDADFEVVD